jgi:uncharacterized protein YycO
MKAKKTVPRLLLPFILCCAALAPSGCQVKTKGAAVAGYAPQDGDFLFQSLPRNPLIVAIEGSTGSPFSHCGIVVQRDGKWMVLEAIGPVRETPLSAWIAQGRDNAYVAYRLKEPLHGKVPAIIAAAEQYKGRPYDIHYEMDDAKIYCSELLWKATRDATGVKLGKIQKLGELNWKPHEAVMREIENGGLPLEREMITPRAVTEDPRLAEVHRFRM